MKNNLAIGCYKYKNSEPPIFLNDLSTCCRGLPVSNTYKKVNKVKHLEQKSSVTGHPLPPVASLTSKCAPAKTFFAHSTLDGPLKNSNPVTSTAFKSSPDHQTDNQHILIIEKPSDNHLVVQTASCVSSVTVNTGSQYIHNIYPDRSCVYVEPSTRNVQCAGTNRVVSHENYKKSYPDVQVTHSHLTSENAIIVDNDEIPIYTEPLSTTKSSEFFALKEKIHKKPMPKSKKQSLLRTVLMNESIESMNKHLQSNNTNPSNLCPESLNSVVSNKTNEEFCSNPNINVASNNTDQNEKEPILKSIIQPATERLLNLKRKHENIDNSNQQRLQKNVCGNLDGNSDLHSKSIQETLNNQLPKIKIRPVEELQEHRPNCLGLNGLNEPNNTVNLHNVDSLKGLNESSGVVNLHNVDSSKDLNESNNIANLHDVDSNDMLQETNVTGLKQCIIEASRTLVNTQKKLKELAKIISNKLTFQTGKATEMVTTFQDILKLCQKQIDVIDDNITSQYYHKDLQNRKPAESVGVSTDKVMKKSLHVQRRKEKIKHSKLHFSRNVLVPVKELEEEEEYEFEKTNASNDSFNMTSHQQNSNLSKEIHKNNMMDEISVKRKRDLIDLNPLGKKVILGTPEITQEDIEQIDTKGENMSNQEKNLLLSELAQKQLYFKKLKKKKNVWSYTSKKRANNKNNLIKKKIRRTILNSWNKNDNDRDIFPKKQSKFVDERLRRRNKKSCRPLRSSERNHPSSASLAASTFPLQGNISRVVSHIPAGCVIKPCSVILHRLDPRIVKLMEKRVKEL